MGHIGISSFNLCFGLGSFLKCDLQRSFYVWESSGMLLVIKALLYDRWGQIWILSISSFR